MEKGLNRLLFDRRNELGFSLKEASIRLDISKAKLVAIENGYKRVKDPDLQKRFITRYSLEANFFDGDTLGYPSLLIDEVEAEKDSIFKKIFKNIWFKVGTLFLFFGFVGMAVSGIVLQNSSKDRNYYSDRFNAVATYVEQNGEIKPSITAKTSEMLLSDYKSVSREIPEAPVGSFNYQSINFVCDDDGNLKKENYGQAFFNCSAIIDMKDSTGLDTGTLEVWFESRPIGNNDERVHFYTYDTAEPLEIIPLAHFSVDFSFETNEFTYNLTELRNFSYVLEKIDYQSLYLEVYKQVFENNFLNYQLAKKDFMEANKDIFHYDSALELFEEQRSGLNTFNSTNIRNTVLFVVGIVLATTCLALFVYSIIVTTKFGKKVYETVAVEEDVKAIEEPDIKPKKAHNLPRNSLPAPIVPEAFIRIVAFILMIVGSLSIYFIFRSILSFDIVGTFESLKFRSSVASFTIIGMILIFFLKLDIIQNKKSTFITNYVLFFAGFVFYIFTLLVTDVITGSPALNKFKVVLDLLPGNIAWGILAFNLLTSLLLAKPKFKNNEKRNTTIYRCLAILPLGYMIASSIIQVGRKSFGWTLPVELTSIFFTKALLITGFSILYCISMFVYRRIVAYKYGKENAQVYELGNRYQYIKNLLVVGIFVILGLFDLLAGMNPVFDNLDLGSNFVGLFCVTPLVFLYHPHIGKRNVKWDLLFNVAYGFSLIIGYVLIICSVAVYIISL